MLLGIVVFFFVPGTIVECLFSIRLPPSTLIFIFGASARGRGGGGGVECDQGGIGGGMRMTV